MQEIGHRLDSLSLMRRILVAFTTGLTLLQSSYLYSHGGGLNSYGCHNQTSNSSYHCHSGVYSGLSFASQDAFLAHVQTQTGVITENSPMYSRDDYLPYWADEDGDCINTRHEALIIESRIQVTMSENGCSVIKGEWLDQATNQIFTEPLDVDIDHTVALAEAHVSGASQWSTERKRTFANDLLNSAVLQVMDDSTNASKSDKDPSEWLPPNESYHCSYVKNWVEVKNLYGLTFDEDEKSAIEKILETSIEYGARKGISGIQASTSKEMARFGMGITEGSNCGYSSVGSLYQSTLIDFSISPDKEHLGQTVDILVVAVLGEDIYSISDKAELVPFTGDTNSLVAFIPATVFRESNSFRLVESVFSEAISASIYTAYRLASGDLIYSSVPFIVEIK
jgi:hypothetical protein